MPSLSNGTVTRNTLIPLGIMASILVAAVMVTWGYATSTAQIDTNTKCNTRQDTELLEVRRVLGELSQAMARVETKLNTKPVEGQ